MAEGPASVDMLGQRIQQGLQVILAWLEERDTLTGADTQALRQDLRMLLQQERLQISAISSRFVL